MIKRIYLYSISILFLFLGGLIYLCYRSPTILLFRFFDIMNFDYSIFQNINKEIPPFFIYNLSNALFVFFGYIVMYIIWDNDKKHFILYTSIITLLNIIYELVTNDISDLITILISFIICISIYYKINRVEYEK